MKKLFSFLFFLLSVTVTWTACDRETPPLQLGNVVSATYDPQTKSFVVKYSSGTEKTYTATVDNSTDPPTASYSLPDGTFLYVADAGKTGDATVSTKVNTVSQFVYDGMSLYYLWADNMTSKKPTVKDVDPLKYFESVLYSVDTQHGWSWMTDDIKGLMAEFSGEVSDAFGFEPFVLWTDNTKTNLVAFVRYVFPNTPASEAGLKRGDIITQVDGQTLVLSNYRKVYGATSAVTFTVMDQYFKNPKQVSITPRKISTNPVFFSKVYEIGGKKIGYLFYTDFISDYNKALYDTFSSFKQAGVTDLVLDLRYNRGGAITAATYLSSLIAPKTAVENKSVFTILSYNNALNTYFDRKGWSRADSLGVYDDTEPNPLNANLNLNKVYIIATSSSYSASELTTFCLKPFMNVVHIGEKTGGKFTASWTIHAYNDFNNKAVTIYDEKDLSSQEKTQLQNWGMQPIVAKYTDKDNKSFDNQGYLAPDYAMDSEEYNPETWVPIGDTKDYLLAKAISLITGQTLSATRSLPAKQMIDANLFSPKDEVTKESVNLDNVRLTPEDVKEIRKLQMK